MVSAYDSSPQALGSKDAVSTTVAPYPRALRLVPIVDERLGREGIYLFAFLIIFPSRSLSPWCVYMKHWYLYAFVR